MDLVDLNIEVCIVKAIEEVEILMDLVDLNLLLSYQT